MPFVNFFLLLIVLASLFPMCTSSHQTSSDVDLSDNGKQETADVDSSESKALSASTPDYSGWKIDVDRYNENNKPLRPGDLYKATFIKNEDNVGDNLPNICKWEIKGGTIDDVWFTVDSTMNYVVLTAYDQVGNIIQKRELKVEE